MKFRGPARECRSNAVVFVGAVYIFLAVLSASAGNLEPVTLQLKWFHQFQFAGYYAARELGYYRDAGFDVRIVERDPARIADTVDEVISGRADFGVSSDAVFKYMASEPVVALAAIFQHSPLTLYVHADSAIRHPQEASGKCLYVPLEPRTATVQAMFVKEGIPLSAIGFPDETVEFPNYIFDPRNEGFSGYATNEPFFLKEYGVEYRELSPITYGIHFYGDLLFTSAHYLKRDPDGVRRFREASLRE